MAEASAPMRRYRLALALLDALIAAGEGEDADADLLRDLMDPWWWALTEAEQQAHKRERTPKPRASATSVTRDG